ncbi:3378_t:CDS:2, partial [Paraglomus occultum]
TLENILDLQLVEFGGLLKKESEAMIEKLEDKVGMGKSLLNKDEEINKRDYSATKELPALSKK